MVAVRVIAVIAKLAALALIGMALFIAGVLAITVGVAAWVLWQDGRERDV